MSAAIDDAVRIAQSKGITSVTEPGIDLRTFGIYADKARKSVLGVRVNALLSAFGAPDMLRDDPRSFPSKDVITTIFGGARR